MAKFPVNGRKKPLKAGIVVNYAFVNSFEKFKKAGLSSLKISPLNYSAMKRSILIISAIFLSALFFTSCSGLHDLQIEKRHYNKGYYVHYNGKKPVEAAALNNPEIKEEEKINSPETEQPMTVIPENEAPVSQNQPENRPAKTGFIKEIKHIAAKAHIITPAFSPAKQLQQKPASSRKKIPADDGTMLVLLVILAILLSPIAVYLKEGATTRFWIDLICWLLGGGFFLTPFFYGGGLLLFAIIFALLIVLDVI